MRRSVTPIWASAASISWTRSDIPWFTLIAEDTREAYGERRLLTLELLEDQVVSIAHNERGDYIRIISIRKATKHEARFYFSQIVDYALEGSQNHRR